MKFRIPAHRFLQMGAVFSAIFCSASAFAQVERFELANGITVIVNPVSEAEAIGVETVYEVGFVDEPKDMCQSSHLLEHLVCYAPGAGFKPKEAMDWLNKNGMANAETTPDMTHYDYVSTTENFEKILQIEAARLKLSSFAPEMIAFEAKRVYSETDSVERVPQTGMVKHGFMALIHNWKHGAPHALVRGGLDKMDPQALLNFYQRTYCPANLTIAITGNTTAKEARALVEKHFAKIPSGKKVGSPIDWSKVAPKSEMTWDAKPTAICIAWSPPKTESDCISLSVLSAIAMTRLNMNQELKKNFHMTMCSNQMWKVGDLPVFIYATPKKTDELDNAVEMLEEAFTKELAQAAAENLQLAKSFGFQFEFQQKPMAWARVKQQTGLFTSRGRTEEQAIQMILVQDALNRTIANRFLGPKPATTIEAIKNLKSGEMKKLVEATLKKENRHIVVVRPK